MKLRGKITSIRACDERVYEYGRSVGYIRHGWIATVAVYGHPPLHTEIEVPLTGRGIRPDLGVELEITILNAKPKRKRR